jgi:PadR family transcriptional regulator, regulatory protein AphA
VQEVDPVALRYALLALLEATPMSGYELTRQFDASAAYVWHAHHPQIYTELRRMEADGLVEAEEAPRGAGATKRHYFITDLGCDELLRWVSEVAEPARERDAAYLKATYFEFGSFDLVRRHLRSHLEHYERMAVRWQLHADQLERRDTLLLRQRLAHAPRHAQAAIVAFKVHVYRGLTERAHTEVRWARQGLELVERLENEAGLPADETVYRPTPPKRPAT